MKAFADWFACNVMFLNIWRNRDGVYLYIHFLPRHCYRVFWNRYQGFGADRYLKANRILRGE